MEDRPEPAISEAAQAAASVRFQPRQDVAVCPACYHPAHWGAVCAECLCVKVRPRTQAGDEPVEEQDLWPDPAPEHAEPDALESPSLQTGRHRRQVSRGQLFSRLRARVYRR